MRVVVTGAAGFIGSHLVDALLAEPCNSVVAFDNLRRGALAHLAQHEADPRLSVVIADVADRRAVAEALAGTELVYHLAAQSNVMGAVADPRYSFEANVAGSFNVLEAAASAGVRRVVFTSSREVYGDAANLPVDESQPVAPRNPYGASKAAAELYCDIFWRRFGLDVAVVRLANVYGPRDRDRVIPLWLECAAAGQPLDVFGGDQVIDFVPVPLAVEALLRVSTILLDGLPINVGSGTGTPLLALARRILDLHGGRGELRMLPARDAEVRHFVADVGRMRELLKIEPPADPLCDLPALLQPVATGSS
ncbi:MAG TPA: NAD-dependent epimerase/dehydratase family protein [Dehalococcoidia bacterium]|nr:NAD-dependent epimerase/dehydratase family protein [Dehalococcoidia bacterium]